MKYCYNSFFQMEEKGTWTGEKYDINYSSILTRLIQEAGRVCAYYASDVFHDWKAVEETLTLCGDGTEEFVFGFRKSGVSSKRDLQNMVCSRKGTISPENSGLYSIYVLTITKDGRDIRMVLKEALFCSED